MLPPRNMDRSGVLLNVPWCKGETIFQDDPVIRLEQEIMMYTNFMELSDKDVLIRNRLIALIYDKISQLDKSVKLLVYGSYANGLSNPSSDIDLQLMRESSKAFSKKFAEDLVSELKFDTRFTNIDYISRARVPVIKGVHKITGIHFDITFASSPSESIITKRNISWIRGQIEFNDQILPLYRVVRGILRSRGFDIPYKGGASSFLTFLLIISFFKFRDEYCKVKTHEKGCNNSQTSKEEKSENINKQNCLKSLNTTIQLSPVTSQGNINETKSNTNNEVESEIVNYSYSSNITESSIVEASSDIKISSTTVVPRKKCPKDGDSEYCECNTVFPNNEDKHVPTFETNDDEKNNENEEYSPFGYSDVSSSIKSGYDSFTLQSTIKSTVSDIVDVSQDNMTEKEKNDVIHVFVQKKHGVEEFREELRIMQQNLPNAFNVLQFLEFYGFIFDYSNYALKADEVGGFTFRGVDHIPFNSGDGYLCCIDPISKRNIGEICYNFRHIRASFQWCYFMLQKSDNEINYSFSKMTKIDGSTKPSVLRRVISDEMVIQNIKSSYDS